MLFDNDKNSDWLDNKKTIESNLKLWGLNEKTIEVLSDKPEIVEYISSKRYLSPLPKGYQPTILEIRFDDLTYYYQEKGKLPYIRQSSSDYTPEFSEYLVDDEECVVFKVGSQLVIDRSANLEAQDFQGLWPEYEISNQLQFN